MMKKAFVLGLMVLAATPAFANIASSQYVGAIQTALEGDLDAKLNDSFDGQSNKILLTAGDEGAVQTGTVGTTLIADEAVDTNKINDGAITNAKVASNAGIGLSKINLPTLCTGAGNSCVLIYDSGNERFVWEDIGRKDSTAPSAGGVSGAGVL